MDIQAYSVLLVPLIVGVVEVFKMAGLPNRFVPLSSLVIGIVIGILYLGDGNILKGSLIGTSLGLSAVGLYSGTKNVMEGRKNNDSN